MGASFGFFRGRSKTGFLGVFGPFLTLFRGGSDMGFLGTFRSEGLEKTESIAYFFFFFVIILFFITVLFIVHWIGYI